MIRQTRLFLSFYHTQTLLLLKVLPSLPEPQIVLLAVCRKFRCQKEQDAACHSMGQETLSLHAGVAGVLYFECCIHDGRYDPRIPPPSPSCARLGCATAVFGFDKSRGRVCIPRSDRGVATIPRQTKPGEVQRARAGCGCTDEVRTHR